MLQAVLCAYRACREADWGQVKLWSSRLGAGAESKAVGTLKPKNTRSPLLSYLISDNCKLEVYFWRPKCP